MASKMNWIAFILYISLYMPKSFSTTLEPSSESSYLSSLPTGSMHNASDITNSSILPQLTFYPSPEISTGSQEASHINEEQSTQTTLRTTVLLGHGDLIRDEYSSTRLTGSTISSLDGDVNSTAQSEVNPATGSHFSTSRYLLPYLQKKHTISKEKLSYVKVSSAKKEVLSKYQHFTSTDEPIRSSISSTKKEEMHFVTTNESNASSVPNSVSTNETLESPDRDWGDVSNLSKSTGNDESSSKLSALSEATQAPDGTSDFQGIGNNTAGLQEDSNPDKGDMQSEDSHGHEGRTGLNSSFTKMDNQDFHLEPDLGGNILGHNQTMALEEESSKSKPVLPQNGSDIKKGDTNDFVSDGEFTLNEENTTYSDNSTEFLFSDHMLSNSSSTYENVPTSSKVEKSSVPPQIISSGTSRKKRSSDISSVAHTEPPKHYLTPPDSSSEVVHSLSTGLPHTAGFHTHLITSTKDISDATPTHAEDSFAQPKGKNQAPQSTEENASDSSYATTLHFTDSTADDEQSISPTIDPVSRASSPNASGPDDALSTLLIKETAGSEGTGSPSEASDSQNFGGKNISESVTLVNNPPVASRNDSLENASVPENAVVTSVQSCTDDEETDDLESTSEISIKVFPLCEKQPAPKVEALGPSSEEPIFRNETPTSSDFIQGSPTKVQSAATSTPESTLEVLQNPRKTLDPSTYEIPLGEEQYLRNTSMSSSELDEPANDPVVLKDANLSEPISSKSSIEKAPVGEDVLSKPSKESASFEASEAPKTESHGDLTAMKFVAVGEEADQSVKDQNVITPSEIGNIDSNTNESLKLHSFEQTSSIKTDAVSQVIKPSLHESLKETISNSSPPFDYVADQSEFLPVVSNFSFLQDFTTKKEFKTTEDDDSTDVSDIYPAGDNTDSNKVSSSDSNSETVDTDVISSEDSKKSVVLKAVEENISSDARSQISPVQNSTTPVNADEGNQELDKRKTKADNSTNVQTKIAGVGVKTTVSVSLNVSKTNSTNTDDNNKNGFNDTAGPIVTLINLTASGQKLANEFIKIANSLETPTESSQGPNDEPKEPPSISVTNSSKSPVGTPPPSPQPSTTRRSFALRKPRIRMNGGDSDNPVTRKPFFVKTPPTRGSDLSSPVVIFQQQARTRLGSITSSTTASTTLRTSRRPYTGLPISWTYGFGNLSLVSETETVPTTTEEEVTEDSDAEAVSFPTVSGCDNIVIKVAASLVVKKGINCMIQFKNKHSPEYRIREKRIQTMLEVLYIGSEIAQRLCTVEIEGFHCSPKSGRVTVDYHLYLSRNGSAVEPHQLVGIFNSRLENSTFNRYILDPNGTVFEKAYEEIIMKPTPPSDAVEPPIPQWAIAVIVIGAASLVFIILFGALTVYGRHHMRRRYNGSHLGDDDADRAIDTRDWDEKTATYENLAADCIYDIDDGSFDSAKRGPYLGHARHSKVSRHDSWKSDWTEPPRRFRYPTDPAVF